MPKRHLILAALALLPILAQAAGDAGTCRYVPLARLDVDASNRHLPTVTGAINGKPAPMLVDTGADYSMLVRRGAERLGLALEMTPGYASGVSASRSYLARVDDFSVGDSHTGKMAVPVLGSLSFEPHFDAIVGADYLLQTDMEVALADKYVRFFRASGCDGAYLAYWGPSAMEIPFIGKVGNGNKPLVQVTLNGVQLTAMLDTGAAVTTVKRSAAERAGFSVDAPTVRKGGSIGGVGDARLDSWSADFKAFSIGDETVNNPRMVVSDDSKVINDGADILLGDDFLRAHRVLFAMSQNRLYLSYLGGELFGAHDGGPGAAGTR